MSRDVGVLLLRLVLLLLCGWSGLFPMCTGGIRELNGGEVLGGDDAADALREDHLVGGEVKGDAVRQGLLQIDADKHLRRIAHTTAQHHSIAQ